MAKINIINAKSKYEGAIHAAIYCRVSTAHKAQLNSLTAQISGLTNKIAYMPNYVLFDSYVVDSNYFTACLFKTLSTT